MFVGSFFVVEKYEKSTLIYFWKIYHQLIIIMKNIAIFEEQRYLHIKL